jgi:hypothetical protein
MVKLEVAFQKQLEDQVIALNEEYPNRFLIESEILVLWARSEIIGSAIGQVRFRCQVSGVRCQ